MKTILMTLFVIGGILAFSACEKNPCKDVKCENGGFCDNGDCQCPPGYTGAKCETFVDTCNDTVCQNGAYCSNGKCICPEGYTGVSCETQKTPRKMRIHRITVEQFPETNNGTAWDAAGYADVFPKLLHGTNTLWSSDLFIKDASDTTAYNFKPGLPVELPDVTGEYTIALYDRDQPDADQLMGGYTFTAYDSTAGFPKVLTLNKESGLSFKVEVSYTW